MISTQINFEITQYREKLLAGLSIRQLVCVGIAGVVAVGTFAVGLNVFKLSVDALSYIVMVEVIPFLGFGFIQHNGYNFEQLLRLYWRWYTVQPNIPIRPYKECYNVSKKARRGAKSRECQAAATITKKEAEGRTKAARKSIAAAKKDCRKEQRERRKADKAAARAAKGK